MIAPMMASGRRASAESADREAELQRVDASATRGSIARFDDEGTRPGQHADRKESALTIADVALTEGEDQGRRRTASTSPFPELELDLWNDLDRHEQGGALIRIRTIS